MNLEIRLTRYMMQKRIEVWLEALIYWTNNCLPGKECNITFGCWTFPWHRNLREIRVVWVRVLR